ncbi:MAG: sigma-70 family RNA polymerase sigma factor [Planctomycetes bacterium]|nr:sigma-70 family RNA polymerase sigma factor [Planctomycetota bacterium]
MVKPPTTSESPADLGAALMLKVRAGDHAAFARLVELHQRTVLNTVFRYVGNRATAEELAQDVFVRVFRARESYEPKAKFETWLFRIAFNVCVNASQYGNKRRALSIEQDGAAGDHDEGEAMQLDDGSASAPLDVVEKDELRSRVRDAVARLPPQQREALLMARFGNAPHTEIAEHLHTTVEAVKSLLFRARENLRGMLKPYLREEVRDEL